LIGQLAGCGSGSNEGNSRGLLPETPSAPSYGLGNVAVRSTPMSPTLRPKFSLWRDRRGLSTVEYAIVLVLVVAVCIGVFQIFGQKLRCALAGANAEFGRVSGEGPGGGQACPAGPGGGSGGPSAGSGSGTPGGGSNPGGPSPGSGSGSGNSSTAPPPKVKRVTPGGG
jgi:Flp pilus assembly pilin Flp